MRNAVTSDVIFLLKAINTHLRLVQFGNRSDSVPQRHCPAARLVRPCTHFHALGFCWLHWSSHEDSRCDGLPQGLRTPVPGSRPGVVLITPGDRNARLRVSP